MAVRVQAEDFDVNAEIDALRRGKLNVGAVAVFVGLVRDLNEGDNVSTMSLEHYSGMTEKSIQAILDEAARRWSIVDAAVVHRIGELKPADRIVLVAVASSHRGEAFAACEFIMDYLKTRAPFWKKEQTPENSRWVEARAADDAAAGRWEGGKRRPGPAR